MSLLDFVGLNSRVLEEDKLSVMFENCINKVRKTIPTENWVSEIQKNWHHLFENYMTGAY